MQRGSTALLIASLKGMPTTVAELLKKKADVNIRNEVIKISPKWVNRDHPLTALTVSGMLALCLLTSLAPASLLTCHYYGSVVRTRDVGHLSIAVCNVEQKSKNCQTEYQLYFRLKIVAYTAVVATICSCRWTWRQYAEA